MYPESSTYPVSKPEPQHGSQVTHEAHGSQQGVQDLLAKGFNIDSLLRTLLFRQANSPLTLYTLLRSPLNNPPPHGEQDDV